MAAMTPEPWERAVSDGYELDLRELLRDAARALRGSKRVVWAGVLAWLAISVAVAAVTWALGLGDMVSAALGVLATAPVTVGLSMVGARRAAGLAVSLADLGAYRAATGHAAIVLLIHLLVVVGGEAATGPVGSLLLSTAYGLFASLALFLVADRGLSGPRAIVVSAQLVLARWPTLLALQLVLAGALAVAALPFGLGLIWAVPFVLIAQGAVYVRAVGLSASG